MRTPIFFLSLMSIQLANPTHADLVAKNVTVHPGLADIRDVKNEPISTQAFLGLAGGTTIERAGSHTPSRLYLTIPSAVQFTLQEEFADGFIETRERVILRKISFRNTYSRTIMISGVFLRISNQSLKTFMFDEVHLDPGEKFELPLSESLIAGQVAVFAAMDRLAWVDLAWDREVVPSYYNGDTVPGWSERNYHSSLSIEQPNVQFWNYRSAGLEPMTLKILNRTSGDYGADGAIGRQVLVSLVPSGKDSVRAVEVRIPSGEWKSFDRPIKFYIDRIPAKQTAEITLPVRLSKEAGSEVINIPFTAHLILSGGENSTPPQSRKFELVIK